MAYHSETGQYRLDARLMKNSTHLWAHHKPHSYNQTDMEENTTEYLNIRGLPKHQKHLTLHIHDSRLTMKQAQEKVTALGLKNIVKGVEVCDPPQQHDGIEGVFIFLKSAGRP